MRARAVRTAAEHHGSAFAAVDLVAEQTIESKASIKRAGPVPATAAEDLHALAPRKELLTEIQPIYVPLPAVFAGGARAGKNEDDR